MKKNADWMAWSLQFIVGLVVGAILGLRALREPELIPRQGAAFFILGTALIGGALASIYGDQLWIGESYRVIPPDAPEQSGTSRTVSMIIALTGGLCLLGAVVLPRL